MKRSSKSCDCFASEREYLAGILSMCLKTFWSGRQGGKKLELDSSQWTPLQGQEARGTDWIPEIQENSLKHEEKIPNFLLENGETLEEVVQRCCEVSVLGDIRDKMKCSRSWWKFERKKYLTFKLTYSSLGPQL